MAGWEAATLAISLLFFAIWCFQWYIFLLAILYGKWKLHRKPQSPCPEDLPGVSILKPLTGIDPHLYENLDTFFNIDYPHYELLFCVEEEMDAAVMVVRSLLEKYPKVDAKLFIGAKKVGINPKINNMAQGYEAAKHDHILISDSGLRIQSSTLRDLVSCMTPHVGLVHQMPFACDRKGFAAVVEKIYFGTWMAKMYLNAEFLGINCVTGMSCLFRKEIIDEMGGLGTFGTYLAEDFYLAQAFLDRGWGIRVCSQPALQNPGNPSLRNFHLRMIRWAKLRAALMRLGFRMEPLSQCTLTGILGAWAVTQIFNWSGIIFFFIHVLSWSLLDYIILQVLQGSTVPFSRFEYLIGWLFCEISFFYIHIKAQSDTLLVWRNKTYILHSGSIAEEITKTSTL